MRKITSVVAAFALVALTSVVVDLGSAEPASAGPAECGPFGDRFFQQNQQGDGRPSGSPIGTDPGAIDLNYLGGHPRALYSWALVDTSLEVKRLVLVAQTSTQTEDSPGTSGSFTTAPNARRIIFCFGEAPDPGITVQKESINYRDTDGDGVANTPITGPDTIRYAITVTNTGNVALDDVQVTDPTATIASCIPALPTTLAPGEASVCSATIVVGQADVDTGTDIFNTATGSGSYRGQTLRDSDTFDVPIQRAPAIQLTKTPSVSTISAPGTIDYTLTVENTGNVTITDVEVRDFDVDSLACPTLPGDLAPGTTATCTASTGVTQADIDAGDPIENTASVLGAFDNRSVSDQASATVAIDRVPAITIDKTSDNFPPGSDPGKADPGIDTPGDIEYTITVENTGNVTLTGVSVSDVTGPSEDVGPLDCSGLPTALAPGASGTCDAVIAVDQDRLDAGGDVINTAYVVASGGGQDLTAGDSYDVPIVQSPSLSLDKDSSSNPDTDGNNVANTPITSPGGITYTYEVTNDGNVTIEGIGIGDTVTTGDGTTALTVTCPDTTLAPAASTTCTATYPVSQDDIDAVAPVINAATVTGTSVSGADVFDTDAFTVPVSANPGLTVTKSSTNYPDSTGDGIADTSVVGPDTIAYEIVVANAGNVTLNDVVVADATLPGLVCAWPGTAGVLQPSGDAGDSVTCTGTTTVDQFEFDTNPAGAAVNVVVALDTVARVGGADFFVVPFDRQPSLAFSKTSTTNPDADGDGVADTPLTGPGTIDYELVLVNTGNTTLEDPVIVDSTLGTLSCDAATAIAPGGTYTCTGSYTVDQAGFDNGEPLLGVGDDAPLVANLALGAARPPLPAVGDPLVDGDFFVVPFDRRPGVAITKTSTSNPDTDGDGIANTPVDAPGTIDYSMTVENTGNVTLTGVTVLDPDASGLSCGATSLAPGASTTCTATGTATQADIDAGGDILNTATVTATGAGATVTDSDTFDVPIEQRVAAVLSKSSPSHPDSDGDGIADTPIDSPGAVAYVVTGTNTGNVSFTDVTVTDPLVADLTCTFPGADGVVPPGESITCSGTLQVGQDLIDTGGDLVNVATAVGNAIGQSFSDDTAYDIPILQDASLGVTKTPTEQSFVIGSRQTVTWRIEVVNDGNVTLDDVQVADFLVEDSEAPDPTPVPECTATVATLAPGDSLVLPCSVDRAITEAEFANLVVVAGESLNAGPAVAAAGAIVRSTGELPETGYETGPWFLAAASLLGVGTVLLGGTRRHTWRQPAGPA